MIMLEISETTIVLLLAIALYLAFIAIDWAIGKVKSVFKRKENHK